MHVLLLCGAVLGFQREMVDFEAAAMIPAEARVLNLPLQPNSRYVAGHPFLHADKLLLLERPMLLSDMWLHQGTGLYAREPNPVLALAASHSASAIAPQSAWTGVHDKDWDYALIRSDDLSDGFLPAGWCYTKHAGAWWVAKRTDHEDDCSRP